MDGGGPSTCGRRRWAVPGRTQAPAVPHKHGVSSAASLAPPVFVVTSPKAPGHQCPGPSFLLELRPRAQDVPGVPLGSPQYRRACCCRPPGSGAASLPRPQRVGVCWLRVLAALGPRVSGRGNAVCLPVAVCGAAEDGDPDVTPRVSAAGEEAGAAALPAADQRRLRPGQLRHAVHQRARAADPRRRVSPRGREDLCPAWGVGWGCGDRPALGVGMGPPDRLRGAWGRGRGGGRGHP